MESFNLWVFLWVIGFYLTDGQAELSNNPVSKQSDPPCRCCRSVLSSSSVKFAPGKSKVNPSRAAVGHNVTKGEWPWIVALGYNSSSDLRFQCAGILISDIWVMTAAHCVEKPEKYILIARLGGLYINEDEHTPKDDTTTVDVPIVQIISHPRFSSNPKRMFDIAVLRLKSPVEFTENINPICLLNGEEYKGNEFYDGKTPFLVGWKYDILHSDEQENKLHEARVKTVATTKCTEQYRNDSRMLIDDKTICVDDYYKDTICLGVSGAALIFPNSTENCFYLGGFTLYGEYLCTGKASGVNLKIAHFIDWINAVTGITF